jgi:pimeloyl-ACP methyl ester carboxylesterase
MITPKDGDCMSIAPAPLTVETQGEGPDLLFLPGMDGLLLCGPFLSALASSFRVTVPQLPGWGQAPREPKHRTIDDLSFAVLDVLDGFDAPVPVVGASLGAWLATEAATKNTSKIASLALVAPVGVRSAAPTERSYLDLYASSPEDVHHAMYGTVGSPPDLSTLSDEQFLELARAQEAVAYYTWEPYMHNRSLLYRLHRITVPTVLVAGAEDGFLLREDHLSLYQAELPNLVDKVVLPGVGHRVEEQVPDDLAKVITEFVATGAVS